MFRNSLSNNWLSLHWKITSQLTEQVGILAPVMLSCFRLNNGTAEVLPKEHCPWESQALDWYEASKDTILETVNSVENKLEDLCKALCKALKAEFAHLVGDKEYELSTMTMRVDIARCELSSFGSTSSGAA